MSFCMMKDKQCFDTKNKINVKFVLNRFYPQIYKIFYRAFNIQNENLASTRFSMF